jgi:hypothetical protein
VGRRRYRGKAVIKAKEAKEAHNINGYSVEGRRRISINRRKESEKSEMKYESSMKVIMGLAMRRKSIRLNNGCNLEN